MGLHRDTACVSRDRRSTRLCHSLRSKRGRLAGRKPTVGPSLVSARGDRRCWVSARSLRAADVAIEFCSDRGVFKTDRDGGDPRCVCDQRSLARMAQEDWLCLVGPSATCHGRPRGRCASVGPRPWLRFSDRRALRRLPGSDVCPGDSWSGRIVNRRCRGLRNNSSCAVSVGKLEGLGGRLGRSAMAWTEFAVQCGALAVRFFGASRRCRCCLATSAGLTPGAGEVTVEKAGWRSNAGCLTTHRRHEGR